MIATREESTSISARRFKPEQLKQFLAAQSCGKVERYVVNELIEQPLFTFQNLVDALLDSSLRTST